MRRLLGVMGVIAAVLVGSVASPAAAHVEVQPARVPRGGLSVVGFVVPNESETASTIGLEVEFPTRPAVLAAAVEPLPGWTATVTKESTNAGGEAVRRVTWTGGRIGPGEFQRFYVRLAAPRSGKQVVFKALQTYDDGSIVRWIETSPPGAPEAELPAPVLKLARAKRG